MLRHEQSLQRRALEEQLNFRRKVRDVTQYFEGGAKQPSRAALRHISGVWLAT